MQALRWSSDNVKRLGDYNCSLVLIEAGSLELVYGGFTYTRETHQAKPGS